jgi:hypothetical protein
VTPAPQLGPHGWSRAIDHRDEEHSPAHDAEHGHIENDTIWRTKSVARVRTPKSDTMRINLPPDAATLGAYVPRLLSGRATALQDSLREMLCLMSSKLSGPSEPTHTF